MLKPVDSKRWLAISIEGLDSETDEFADHSRIVRVDRTFFDEEPAVDANRLDRRDPPQREV